MLWLTVPCRIFEVGVLLACTSIAVGILYCIRRRQRRRQPPVAFVPPCVIGFPLNSSDTASSHEHKELGVVPASHLADSEFV